MKKPALLLALMAHGYPTFAQDIATNMAQTLGKAALEEVQPIIDEAPEKLSSYLSELTGGIAYESQKECIGQLQVLTNLATITANIIPFSSVKAFEDDTGFATRLRLLVNGEMVSGTVRCSNSNMTFNSEPWKQSLVQPMHSGSTSSFDASLGILLLLQMQGAFDKPKTLEPASNTVGTKDDAPLPQKQQILPQQLRAGEKEAIAVSLKRCWNVDMLPSVAQRTTVTVTFEMGEDGKPIFTSIKMAGFKGGSETAVKLAFEMARRAILRCGSAGLPVPSDRYESWKHLEVVFDPVKFRVK